MLPITALLLALAADTAAARPSSDTASMADAMLGRWDITIRTPERERPSWLEMQRSGNDAIVGRFVGEVGSARPISRIEVVGDRFRFAIPRQWEQGAWEVEVEGRLEGGRLAGTMTFGDGKRHEWSAERAPALRRATAPTWGEPVRLLASEGLAGWRVVGGESRWSVRGGVLANAAAGGNLVTERTFGDFKLHVEFRYPRGSNSGVYLRGRYEVQVADSIPPAPTNDLLGAVYGFIAPSEVVRATAGEWQTYDITLVGRMLTVVANGRTVICDREIPGITGGALDSREGAPGPLMLQGDHGPIEYRNIVVTPAR